jgi:hypothetical protein
MSWSISKIGFAGVVAAKVAEDVRRIKCAEPEESIKNSVGAALVAALEAYPGDFAVRVEATGSQSTSMEGFTVNNLSVKIEPLYGFVK